MMSESFNFKSHSLINLLESYINRNEPEQLKFVIRCRLSKRLQCSQNAMVSILSFTRH